MTEPLILSVSAFLHVDDIEAYLETIENMPSDEPGLLALEHGLQCAADLKQTAPDDEELQVAGLVHDIGHWQCDISIHHEVGANLVRTVLGERVAELVRLHVDAKRYLVSVDRNYAARLSPVSAETFQLQGGAMSAAEISAFESHPFARDATLLRMADEAAKMPGRGVPGLDHWRGPLRRVASRNVRTGG